MEKANDNAKKKALGCLVIVAIFGGLIAVFYLIGDSADSFGTIGYSAYWLGLISSSFFGLAMIVGGAIGFILLIWGLAHGEDIEKSTKTALFACLPILILVGILLMSLSSDYVKDIPNLSNPSTISLRDVSVDEDGSGDSGTTYYVYGFDDAGEKHYFTVSHEIYERYSTGEHPLVTVTYLPNSGVLLEIEE